MTSAQDSPWPFGGVSKDPLDLRDLEYRPSLEALPFELDNRESVPRILNQGREGACTGFALAAVANFLLHNRRDTGPIKESVSARMLYQMARRYDEWEGENYEGSSIRGALKGWHKHGVGMRSEWHGNLTPECQEKAHDHPLGAYYRVRHLYLNDMHAAINETGILYASASVHEGWYEVDPDTGRIPLRRKPAGGHAFAIVGYDEDGFWIQNSWGSRWGLKGCCHISYDDWLENGYDCWVARLGVPTSSAADSAKSLVGRVTGFDYIPHEAVVLRTIRPHFVNLGNDGRFSDTGLYTSDRNEVRRIIREEIAVKAAEWRGTPRILLYAHGGLNDEKASATRIETLLPYFLDNHIYPLHFMWETGLFDSILGIVQDAIRHGRFLGWRDEMKERFQDLMDEAVELGARGLGRPVWEQMKDNARRASAAAGGAEFVARELANYTRQNGAVELHLVGHSAGSAFHAYLIPRLIRHGLRAKSLTLFAPACTTDLFTRNILRHIGRGVERLTVFNLTDEAEKADSVTPAYNRSLLYLVSEALEKKRRTPLLGMQKFVEQDRELFQKENSDQGRRRRPAPAFTHVISRGPTVIYSSAPPNVRLASASKTHGGFDNDEATLNSTLRLVLGSNRLSRSF